MVRLLTLPASHLHPIPCSLDLAVASEVADGWWKRLDELAWQNEVGIRDVLSY